MQWALTHTHTPRLSHLLCYVSSFIADKGESQSQIGEAYCMTGTSATAYETDVSYSTLYYTCIYNLVEYNIFWALYGHIHSCTYMAILICMLLSLSFQSSNFSVFLGAPPYKGSSGRFAVRSTCVHVKSFPLTTHTHTLQGLYFSIIYQMEFPVRLKTLVQQFLQASWRSSMVVSIYIWDLL